MNVIKALLLKTLRPNIPCSTDCRVLHCHEVNLLYLNLYTQK